MDTLKKFQKRISDSDTYTEEQKLVKKTELLTFSFVP
jgi:hypothetical protein